ncbi:putative ankyrin repeat protein L25 [Smittium mucronatum]|uniref:Putative ankyrin repeat protein L25 n=1 Tax=Smittium mucronatum TaxID=133383 RepID=A0A1R0H1S3_9FUNG|nr:putative ankyrin repeat protein L25 [Smittium mucronatum]
MEQVLNFEIIERIFVISQNPELRFLSKSFYKISKSTKARSEFFLHRFGKKNVLNFEMGLPAEFPNIFENEKLVLNLMKLGAKTSKVGQELFYYAIENSWVTVVEYLLKVFVRGFEPKKSGGVAYIKPLISLKESKYESVKLALEYLNKPILILILNSHKFNHKLEGQNLRVAIIKKIPKVDLNKVDFNCYLNIVKERRIDILDILFENGLVIKSKKEIFYPAISNSDIETIEYLVKKGGDFSSLEHGPFNIACQTGNIHILEYMVSHCPKLVLHPSSIKGNSIKHGNADAMIFFHSKGLCSHFFNYDVVPFICDHNYTQLLDTIYQIYNNKMTILKFAFLRTVQKNNMVVLTHLIQNYPGIKDFINQDLFMIFIRDSSFATAAFFIQNNHFSFSQMIKFEKLVLEEIHKRDVHYDKKLYAKKSTELFNLIPLFTEFFKTCTIIDKEEYMQSRKTAIRTQMSLFFSAECNQFMPLEKLKLFIEKDYDIHIDNDQPLINACSIKSNLPVIKHLVENGADVNAKNGSPLINACSDDMFPTPQLEIIKYLVKKGAEINVRNGQIIINACNSNNPLPALKYLIENGADLHSQNDQAFVNICANTCNIESFMFLVQNGADINAQNGEALIKACFLPEDMQRIKFLIKNGVDIHSQNDKALISTCLESNSLDVFGFLVKNGANIHAQNDQALINACSKFNNFKIVKYLVESGANINAQNGQALVTACSNARNLDILKYLISNGADVNAQNGRPLIEACKNYEPFDMIKLLIENGADANSQNGMPLINVCKNRPSLATLRILIENGAVVNSQNGLPLINLCNHLLWEDFQFNEPFDYLISCGAGKSNQLGPIWARVFNEYTPSRLLSYLAQTEVNTNLQDFVPLIEDLSDRIVEPKNRYSTTETLAEKMCIITDQNFLISFFKNPRFKVLKFFASKGIEIIKHKDFILNYLIELIGMSYRDLLPFLLGDSFLEGSSYDCSFCHQYRLRCSCTDIYVNVSYTDEVCVMLMFLKTMGVDFTSSELQEKFGKYLQQIDLIDPNTVSFMDNNAYENFYSNTVEFPMWIDDFDSIRKSEYE